MRENFERAFEITVGLEGGYVNDPDKKCYRQSMGNNSIIIAWEHIQHAK